MPDPLFLTLDEVLALHEDQIRRYGGSRGVRDLGLLESAMGSAAATFDGVFLHETLFEVAAAMNSSSVCPKAASASRPLRCFSTITRIEPIDCSG